MSKVTQARMVNHGIPAVIAHELDAVGDAEGVRKSLLVAVCEQESGFRNVWGHDAGKFREDGEVTRQGVARYFAAPAGRRPNGIGPMQITWSGYQVLATQAGGLWLPAVTTRVGAQALADLVRQHGERLGAERYNGTGPAAVAYAGRVLARARIWHDRLS